MKYHIDRNGGLKNAKPRQRAEDYKNLLIYGEDKVTVTPANLTELAKRPTVRKEDIFNFHYAIEEIV